MPPKPAKGAKGVSSIEAHLWPAPRGGTSSYPGSPPSSDAAAAATVCDVGSLKQELLVALREDFTAIIKAEFQAALGESLSSINAELSAFKNELSSGLAAVQENFTGLKLTVAEVEKSVSTCTDDIVSLQKKVESLTKTVAQLEDKCDDFESRSRRQNIRIIGVPEDDPSSTTTAAVSRMLKEAFGFEEDPLLDQAHRIPVPKPKAGERPRPIVAKLHYHTDCVKILAKAKEQQQIKVNGTNIFVFPDYTARTARARAAFTECRRKLRNIQGVRFGLLHPARLKITHEGTTRVFTSPEEMFYPTSQNLMDLLQALDTDNRLDLLPMIWKDIKTYGHVKVELAEELLSLMARDGHSPEVQEAFAACALDVQSTLTEKPNVECSSSCLSDITCLLLRANLCDRAWTVMQLFRSRSLIPGEALVNNFLSTCQSSGTPQRAVELVQLSAAVCLPSTPKLAARVLAEFELSEEQRSILSDL